MGVKRERPRRKIDDQLRSHADRGVRAPRLQEKHPTKSGFARGTDISSAI
jgi:hypothetical protein